MEPVLENAVRVFTGVTVGAIAFFVGNAGDRTVWKHTWVPPPSPFACVCEWTLHPVVWVVSVAYFDLEYEHSEMVVVG